MAVRVVFGEGAAGRVPGEISRWGARRVSLIPARSAADATRGPAGDRVRRQQIPPRSACPRGTRSGGNRKPEPPHINPSVARPGRLSRAAGTLKSTPEETMWDATKYEARDNLLRVVRREAEQMFAMAEAPDAWSAPTACPQWQVRDIIGHLIDVTESYFVGFDAARGGSAAPDPLGLTRMAELLDEGARSHRDLSTKEALDRLRADFTKLMEMCEALGPQEWGGLTVVHKYMGPLPAFFYPTFQLMDYAVHSWDIRQGTGRAHGLDGEAADLLVPFMLILWQATAAPPADVEPSAIGLRVTSGPNAGTWRISAGPQGMTYEPGDLQGLPAVLEFDAGSLVLTAFGRSNSGTVRGDAAAADRFLNLFFRI